MLFTSHDPMLKDTDSSFLFGDQLVGVSSNNVHASGQYVPLETLCSLSHIVGQKPLRSAVNDQLDFALSEHGPERHIAMDITDFASIFRMMQACALVAFLPAKFAAQQGRHLKQLQAVLDTPGARARTLASPSEQ